MSKIFWAYVVAIVGVLIAAVNLPLTRFEPGFLNGLFQIPNEPAHDVDRIVANLALSLVAMFAATLIGCFLLLADSREHVANESRQIHVVLGDLSKTVQNLPQTRAFSALITSDEGLAYLARVLPDAKNVWNTRLVSTPAKPPRPDNAGEERSEWDNAIVESLSKGAHVYEVVTRAWEVECRALDDAHQTYRCDVVDMQMPAFLNFVVIEYKSGQDREVLFGWLSTTKGGFDNNCFRTTEPRIVEFFKDWHLALRGGGKP
jgi:hypothetical protein